MQALSKKKTGDICTIKWMFGIPDVLDFLRSRKIKEGSTVQVIQRINGGLILGMDGKRQCVMQLQTGFRYERKKNQNERNLGRGAAHFDFPNTHKRIFVDKCADYGNDF